MLRNKLGLDYALVIGFEAGKLRKIMVITLHFDLGVRYKGHLISYLNSKNLNCGKGWAMPRQICFGT